MVALVQGRLGRNHDAMPMIGTHACMQMSVDGGHADACATHKAMREERNQNIHRHGRVLRRMACVTQYDGSSNPQALGNTLSSDDIVRRQYGATQLNNCSGSAQLCWAGPCLLQQGP